MGCQTSGSPSNRDALIHLIALWRWGFFLLGSGCGEASASNLQAQGLRPQCETPIEVIMGAPALGASPQLVRSGALDSGNFLL